MSKKTDLLEFTATQKPHIIIGTETWLSPDVSNNEIIPSDFSYNIYRNDQADGYSGIMLAISNQLPSLEMPSLITGCEIVWAQINLPGCNKLFLGVYYRPYMHDQLSIDELNLSLCQLQNYANNPTIWLAGDFNAPNIDWETMNLKDNCVHASTHNSLLATTCDHGLTQLITEPTRLGNTLDLFFTDHPSQITDINVLPGMSDYDIVMITANIKLKFAVQLPRKVLLYHKANWNAIRQSLLTLATDFPKLSSKNSDVEHLWTIFKKTMLDLMTRYIPCRTTNKQSHLPWITNYIRKLIKKQNTLYNAYKTSRSSEVYNNFKCLKHYIQNEMCNSYLRYINNFIIPTEEENQSPRLQRKF